jgi:acetyltransferase-like isoleucine patch superfamily enzyme
VCRIQETARRRSAGFAACREYLKGAARALAMVLVVPAVCSFYLRRTIMGANRALMGSSQASALIPGVLGVYLRTAFFRWTLDRCAPSAAIEFGTILSEARTRIEENVYIGPMCHIGWAHLERDVLVGAAAHIPSGPDTHGISDISRPIREQPGTPLVVRIGAGTWIGSGAIVMADVGPASVIAAGAVVTRPIPGLVIAGGAPAKVIRERTGAPCASSS